MRQPIEVRSHSGICRQSEGSTDPERKVLAPITMYEKTMWIVYIIKLESTS
jgi:hypothetical protein